VAKGRATVRLPMRATVMYGWGVPEGYRAMNDRETIKVLVEL
jgi:hypothetical protein